MKCATQEEKAYKNRWLGGWVAVWGGIQELVMVQAESATCAP